MSVTKEEVKDLRKKIVKANKILAKHKMKLTYEPHGKYVFPVLTLFTGVAKPTYVINVDLLAKGGNTGTGFEVVFYLESLSLDATDSFRSKYLCEEVLQPLLKDIKALNKLELWTSRELKDLNY